MAINPVLARDEATGSLFPLPQSGETFVLKRDEIDFECKLPRGGKLRGRGQFFLSSTRLVFLGDKWSSRADFKSFEVPLKRWGNPKFEQPIFGANYLTGLTEPEADDGGPLSGGHTSFSLTFNAGGCGTFLPLFFKLMTDVRQQMAQSAAAGVAQAAQEGRLNQVAFVDPSDPSVLYLSQPTAAPGTQERTNFEVDAPSAPPPPAQQGGNPQQQNCVIC
mmetsp:Transcript_40653/g.71547  ORF Transcript_40653/g.71547 Transcript_40653/m.71547 type:complete len:219 (+) Transcript_40653:42-698(+)